MESVYEEFAEIMEEQKEERHRKRRDRKEARQEARAEYKAEKRQRRKDAEEFCYNLILDEEKELEENSGSEEDSTTQQLRIMEAAWERHGFDFSSDEATESGRGSDTE